MTTKKTTVSRKSTTTRSSKPSATAQKSAASVRSVPKVAPPQKPEPLVDSAPTVLRKKEFVEQVSERSNLKKRDVRAAIEAIAGVMGEALRDGRSVAMSPGMKLRPVRQNEFDGGVVVTTKVRMQTTPKPATETMASDTALNEALAEPAE